MKTVIAISVIIGSVVAAALLVIAESRQSVDKQYVLILMLVTPTGSTAISSVNGFTTQALCKEAGVTFSELKGSGYICALQ